MQADGLGKSSAVIIRLRWCMSNEIYRREARPEGPALSSHGRQAVDQVRLNIGSSEGAALQDLLCCHRCENRFMAGKYISLFELCKVIGGIVRKKNGKLLEAGGT